VGPYTLPTLSFLFFNDFLHKSSFLLSLKELNLFSLVKSIMSSSTGVVDETGPVAEIPPDNTVIASPQMNIPMSLTATPTPVQITIDDLLNSHAVTTAKEDSDRSAVVTFTTPSVDSLKPTLYKWAAAGFPGGYIVNTISLTPPSVCSDGVARSLTVYFEYLLGTPIATWLQNLEKLTQGMIFTFSHDGSNNIVLHVTKI
jgi:hypothetical protein